MSYEYNENDLTEINTKIDTLKNKFDDLNQRFIDRQILIKSIFEKICAYLEMDK